MIKQINDPNFKKFVHNLKLQNPSKRILSFSYQHKKYWLKQPEKLKNIELLLKPKPIQSFKNELNRLFTLSKKNAPIPNLVLWGDNFIVLEDGGISIKNLLDKYANNPKLCKDILIQCIQALVNLHKKDIIHGRPALRDMLWQDGNISFIDFENFSKSKDLEWQKIRDSLIFIHSFERMDFLSDQLAINLIEEYHRTCDPTVWQGMVTYLKKYHWLYRFLYLFRSFAHTDLIAFYRLFQQFDQIMAISNSKKEQK